MIFFSFFLFSSFFFIDATFIRQFSFFIGLINSYFVIIFIFFIVQPYTSIFPHPYNFYNRHDNSLGEPSTKFCYFFFKLIPIFLDQPYNFITRAWRRSACVFGRAGYVWWYPTICTRPPIWPGGYIRETSWLEVLLADNKKDSKSFFFDLMIIKCSWHHMIRDFK